MANPVHNQLDQASVSSLDFGNLAFTLLPLAFILPVIWLMGRAAWSLFAAKGWAALSQNGIVSAVGSLISAGWPSVIAFGRVLFVCRVSLASGLVGILLFSLAPQARDLLLEMTSTLVSVTALQGEIVTELFRSNERDVMHNMGFWAGFFVLLVIAWAIPLHYSARVMVRNIAWTKLRPDVESKEKIDQFEHDYAWSVSYVPRLMGLMPFLAIVIGILRAGTDVPQTEPFAQAARSQLDVLLAVTLVLAFSFFWLMYFRQKLQRMLIPALRDQVIESTRQPFRTLRFGVQARSPTDQRLQKWAFIYLGGISIVLFLVMLFPVSASMAIPRALLVPLLVGGLVPALCMLAWLGHFWRAPVLLGLTLVISIIFGMAKDNHDIERTRKAEQLISLQHAVRLWKKANDCDLDSATCPRPIIVTAAGGASRAAFHTASVLGAMLDATATTFDPGRIPRANEPLDPRPTFARHLFAISSVSGSSVGAAMVSAALARSEDGSPPCMAKPPENYFRDRTPPTWRTCLQTLAAGDLLTATTIGLGFRDPLRLPRDRGQLLEDAMASVFDTNVPADGRTCNPENPTLRACGLKAGFSSIAPSAGAPWQPLLLINSTSVDTGRRVIISPLKPDLEGLDFRVFTDAHTIAELERVSCIASSKDEAPVRDMTIAAAAHNSARFPYVSPPGNVLANCINTNGTKARTDDVAARLVDGGYFENYGAITALDLIRALRVVDPRLMPFVMVLSNEPLAQAESAINYKPASIDASDAQLGGWLSTPASALLATRSARGSQALTELRNHFDNVVPRPACVPPSADATAAKPATRSIARFDLLRTNDKTKENLSMSWWLSKPVQAHIDWQVNTRLTPTRLGYVCDAMFAEASAQMCKTRVSTASQASDDPDDIRIVHPICGQ
jgi:hypothetical protein